MRRSRRAGRRDRVLLASESNSACGVDAERGELGVAELDEDPLVLHAVEVDLGHPVDLEQALAQAFRHALQLGVVGAWAGQHVEDGIDVAVFVVDGRGRDAGRQVGRTSSIFLRIW